MWLALIVVIGVTLGRMIWVCAADVLAFGRENKPVTITVYESDTMDSITDKLYDAGLIRYKSLFNFYADISHAEKKIDPGIYDLNTRYDYHALVNMMSASSTREVVEDLLIPEGLHLPPDFRSAGGKPHLHRAGSQRLRRQRRAEGLLVPGKCDPGRQILPGGLPFPGHLRFL